MSIAFDIDGKESLLEKATVKLFDGDKLVGESTFKMQTLMNGGTNYTGNPTIYKSAGDMKYHMAAPRDSNFPIFNDDEKITGSVQFTSSFLGDDMWVHQLEKDKVFPKSSFPIVPVALCCAGTAVVGGGGYYYYLTSMVGL